MASSIIGQLRVILGLDTAQFDRGLSEAERNMTRAARSYEQIGNRIQNVGKSMSVGVTLPLVAIGGAALKAGANFETAMNKVQAATMASGKELKALRDQAKAFGADKSLPATAAETASAMENLAKNGRSVQEILGGATEATLRLAAATGGELPAAADLATDIMAQFGKRADELPGLVDKISGAMVASKLDFDNYRLAIGQAGSVAGNVMGFEEFNAAIASTAAGFASGSDAGTSFKTFIQRLTPQSKEAASAIKQLGLDFFDAQGKLRPIGEIAEQLRVKLGRLTKESQGDFLNTIFGSDSSRTAIELMKQGADGVARMGAEIDKVKAADQAAALMKGWSGAAQQVRKAFESAAIALGDSGFLDGMTRVALSVADVIRSFSALPQPALFAIGVFAAVAAAAGPVVFIAGKIVSGWGLMLGMGTRLAAMLGIVAAAETAVGTAGTAGAVGATRMGVALRFLGGPWGVAIGLVATAIWGVYAATQSATKGVTEQAGATRIAADAAATMNGILSSDPSKGIAKNARELAASRISAAKAAYAQAAGEIALRKSQAATEFNNASKGYRTETRTRYEAVPGSRSRRAVSYEERVAVSTRRGGRGGDNTGRSEADRIKDAARKTYAEANRAEATLKGALERTIAAANAGGNAPPAGNTGGNVAMVRDTGSGKKPKVEDLAAKRAELQLQAQIDAAQERGDEASAQALRDRLDLTKQIAAYEDAGLKKGEATIAAQRDLSAIQAARAQRMAEEVVEHQRDLDINVAQISGNQALIEKLERQRDVQEGIAFYRGKGFDLAKATLKAETDQLRIDEARAAVRRQWFEQDARDRAIRLAELRGDSEEQIRALRAQDYIANRTRDIMSHDGTMSEAQARAQATTEAMEEEQARQQGIFRDTIKGGFHAALDGQFGNWFERWWKDRVAKGMEEALNSLADLIANLFSKAGQAGANGGGGGILGAIGSILGGIGGGGSSNPWGPGIKAPDLQNIIVPVDYSALPRFNTGGSFKVGGMAGIDRNVVSMRLTKGEMVDIRKPGNDNGGGGDTFVTNVTVPAGVDLATREETYRLAAAVERSVMMKIAERDARRA